MQSSHASTCVFKLVAPTVRSTSLRPSVRPSVRSPERREMRLTRVLSAYLCVATRTREEEEGRRKGVRGVHKPACIQIKLPEKLLISGPIATGPFISGPRASLSARITL